jgi:hypothetical protein
MSVPPDRLMELMRNQQGGASATSAAPATPDVPPNAPGMSDTSTAPMSAPMSTPEPKMGNKEGGMVNVSMAQDLLEQALVAIGSDTEEGKSVLNAINTLNKVLGPKKSKVGELQQSEIIQMLQNLPQAGGATPEGRAMQQAPAVPNLPPMPAMAAGQPQPM